jgi:two-component system chemotaxis sensor kinase CheA
MADRNEIRDTFFLECEELLEALDDGLREIDALISTGNEDSETVNAVFRAVHSIKGGAGAFGLDSLVEFAHGFETALDFLRSGKLVANTEMLWVFYRAKTDCWIWLHPPATGKPLTRQKFLRCLRNLKP